MTCKIHTIRTASPERRHEVEHLQPRTSARACLLRRHHHNWFMAMTYWQEFVYKVGVERARSSFGCARIAGLGHVNYTTALPASDPQAFIPT